MLSERLWTQAYGRDPGIVGRRLEIDGAAREIVGIMPASFHFPAADTEIWLPIGIDPAKTDSASFDYRGIGRLRDGVSVSAAQADLQRLLLQLPAAFPGRLTLPAIKITKMRTVVAPLRDVIVGQVSRLLWVIFGAVGCILLVGCANVANLFLARAEARRVELAVRRALGASRAAIVRALVSEAAILAAIGGALGLAAAAAGLAVLRSFQTSIDLPRLTEIGLDGAAIGVAVGLSALVALLVSGIPAIRASAGEAALSIDGGRSTTAGRVRHRARRLLVVAQIAISLVLVAAAGLMARSFAHLRTVQPGFDPAHVYTFRLALPAADYPTHADLVRLLDEALDDIRAMPGVQSAGTTTKLPLVDTGRLDGAIFINDRPLPPGGFPAVHQISYVSPEYFQALSIPFAEGTTFRRMDPEKALPQVILSDTVAQRYWGHERAVGRQVRLAPMGPSLTVVGVVKSVRGTGLDQPLDEMIYLPIAATDPRWAPRDFAFVVRVSGAPATLAPAIARVLRRVAPTVPLYAREPMTDIVTHAQARTSFLLLLLAAASLVAMLLGAVGLFGMCAYVVTLRRREIAIRLALGATPSEVRQLVGRQGLLVAVAGVLLGLVGALAATRVLAGLLFGVSPLDPGTLAIAALVMLTVAAVATWLPARRASAVDPAEALRAE
jgi:predicted permease